MNLLILNAPQKWFIVQHKRNVSVIQDVDGNNIVIINDIRFKGKRSVDWKDVREYLKEHVGLKRIMNEYDISED